METGKPKNPEIGVEKRSEAEVLATAFTQRLAQEVGELVVRLQATIGQSDSPGFEERWQEAQRALNAALGDRVLTKIVREKVDGIFGSGFYDHIQMGK